MQAADTGIHFQNTPTRRARDLHQDTEVIAGVRWGRREWVPSPAYWADMLQYASEDNDGYISQSIPLVEEVGFCLLGGYGITAEVNHAAHDHLRQAGVYRKESIHSDEIEALLRTPLRISERSVRYRFPRQRAIRLATAIETLRTNDFSNDDPIAFRRQLMSIPGIGPKTASWITRNWLGSDEVAILDIHIIRAGLVMGLFSPDLRVPRDYEVMEKRFLEFSNALGVRPSLLDAVMWREMRTMRSSSI